MSKSALDPNITVADLMAIDYHYNYSDGELMSDWYKLCNTTQFKSGSQFRPGIKLCQHFFPNFWHIRNSRGTSFAQCWQDRNLMEDVLQWGKKGMSQLWMSWIRRAIFMRAGLPNSSFYRPHFSRQIILESGIRTGTLFDPCAGWGGRMLGTVSSGWHYIACEPNTETYRNLLELVEFLGIADNVTLLNQPAEHFDYGSLRGKVDVVLTSPPYFNLEVYSAESTQSYNKHKNYTEWKDQWLIPLIKECTSLLKPSGVSCWNAMNFAACPLAADVVDAHHGLGWKVTNTLGFRSPLENIRTVKNKDLTYVFKKT